MAKIDFDHAQAEKHNRYWSSPPFSLFVVFFFFFFFFLLFNFFFRKVGTPPPQHPEENSWIRAWYDIPGFVPHISEWCDYQILLSDRYMPVNVLNYQLGKYIIVTRILAKNMKSSSWNVTRIPTIIYTLLWPDLYLVTELDLIIDFSPNNEIFHKKTLLTKHLLLRTPRPVKFGT